MVDVYEKLATAPNIGSKMEQADFGDSFDSSAKRVCLTYDDGPAWQYTHPLIELLSRLGRENSTVIRATFFVCGGQITVDDEHDNPVRRAHREDHLIANHSFSHPEFSEIGRSQMRKEISDTNDKIVALGIPKPKYFRAPYGDVPCSLPERLLEAGMTHVGWEVDSSDWSPGITAAQIVDNVMSRLKDFNQYPTQVILFHDGGGDRSQTVLATEILVPKLLALGCQFVRTDEIR